MSLYPQYIIFKIYFINKKMTKNYLILPFVKWAGGKRQLLKSIIPFLPDLKDGYTYIEPFVGGGALLFYLKPKNAIINDLNEELINTYEVIKYNIDELIERLKTCQNTPEYYYSIRGLDRHKNFHYLSNIERASRLIYLNKTCYNGLYRVNKSGFFNSPFGKYKKTNIINESVLRAVHDYLSTNNISIYKDDYKKVLENIPVNSFVYLDPPYHPLKSNSFRSYIQDEWGENQEIELLEVCKDLDRQGIKFMMSNSSSPFILNLYKDFHIDFIKAGRKINSNSKKRGKIQEIIIRNYE